MKPQPITMAEAPENFLKFDLKTRLNEYVITAAIPPMNILPEAIAWGNRIFFKTLKGESLVVEMAPAVQSADPGQPFPEGQDQNIDDPNDYEYLEGIVFYPRHFRHSPSMPEPDSTGKNYAEYMAKGQPSESVEES